ncbi:hypothetical protein [Planosporangium mesophilum]|uniref:Uncharacterized protein n=1 Tax=Planosporangium mesophilum TaxID=689768 RepID=A0A8J3TRP4_9ACTN|nr:hypothetical protein [Planosporangium mesophilum]NJC86492.1 hypothetical protein [Planosporangium mesophilum]GII26085.1 hypothetical protein Pme01_56820 [Planosporangium mesophilum]
MGRDGARKVARCTVDRRAAESLARGDHRADVPDALVRLLAAAAAPARDSELAGEEPAVVAFRRYHRPPMHAPGRRSLLARLLTVKITVAFALTAVGGGAALAAAGGFHRSLGTSGLSPRPAAPSAAPSSPAASPRGTGSAAAAPKRPVPSPTLSRPPTASLCRILVADARNRSAGVHMGLDSPAFAALVALAGDAAGVWSFCSRLLTMAGVTAAPGTPYPAYGDRYHNYPGNPGYPYPRPDPDHNDETGQAADRAPFSPTPAHGRPASPPLG